MDWVHLHLLLCHVPVLGSLFVALMLAAGMWRRSEEIKRMSLNWFVCLTLIGVPIKFTGDFAFEKIGKADWIEFGQGKTLRKAHEQAADQATTGIFLLGVVAGVGLFLGRKERPMPKWVYPTTMALALITFALMARAANLGGQIRHDEIRASPTLSPPSPTGPA